MEIKVKYNPVYKQYLRSGKRYNLLYGGRGSAKSWHGVNGALESLLSTEYRRIVLMRYIYRDVRYSLWQGLKDQVEMFGLNDLITLNEHSMTATGPNDNLLICRGFKASRNDATAKSKSLTDITDVVIEEADEVPELDFLKLDGSLRTTKGRLKITLIFNPEDENCWIAKRWFVGGQPKGDPDSYILQTTYKDNLKYLEKSFIRNLENLETSNPEWYKVYTLGEWGGGPKGKIYSHWQRVLSLPEGRVHRQFGLDFGYTNDPTCLVETIYDRNKLWGREHIYQVGLGTRELASMLKDICGKTTIYADSAEPRTIADLRQYGLNVMPATKGQGSVSRGIQFIKDCEVFITEDSHNAWKEYRYYIWKLDKDGNPLNEPAPSEDHFMDALRYSVSHLYMNKRKSTGPTKTKRRVRSNRKAR